MENGYFSRYIAAQAIQKTSNGESSRDGKQNAAQAIQKGNVGRPHQLSLYIAAQAIQKA